jgi:sugar transferase (PEP-CTERM/EpsH1 system associated)
MNLRPPLIAHVIQRLATGGLENGLVNLINHMAYDRYRHAIICLTTATDYASRIQRKDVEIIELNKRQGQNLGVHARYFRLLRTLRPDIVHTRNLPALEFQSDAALAKVPGRIHGEHGRDMYDLEGKNFKYNSLRKLMRPFIHRYIAVSKSLSNWLVHELNVSAKRVIQIYNGVDTEKFRPVARSASAGIPSYVRSSNTFVLGTVGRMEAVKDQLVLVRAFLHLRDAEPTLRERLRLIVIGDGPIREQALALLQSAGAEGFAWLPGERNDIEEVLRSMDLFVLPSLIEGISNTILEAMASGLPVVATRVGGNPELVDDGETGSLIPASDPIAMAQAIQRYTTNPEKVRADGAAGRKKAANQFSISAMVNGYMSVYDSILNGKRHRAAAESRAYPVSSPERET